jgi:hypothetical protein
MKPVSKKLLVNTVTLFNCFTDPDTGLFQAYRTILEHVRVMTVKSSLGSNFVRDLGAMATSFENHLLMDRRNTSAYDFDEFGGRLDKAYLDRDEWTRLSDENKAKFWTLCEKDWLYCRWGEIISICPSFDPETMNEQEFKDQHNIRALSAIAPTLDKDGSIHSWEVPFD